MQKERVTLMAQLRVSGRESCLPGADGSISSIRQDKEG
jgi:hypothetical protein